MPKKKKPIEMPTTTVEQIREAAADAVRAAAEFRGIVDRFNNPAPATSEWIDATEALIESYCPRAIPVAQRQIDALDRALKKMLAEFELRQQAATDENVSLVPSAFFWLTFDQCVEALHKPRPIFKRPPSPLILSRDQKVAPRQIARIWGWLLDDKSPDEEKVLREIETPGSELTDEDVQRLEREFYIACGFEYVEPEPAVV